MTANPYALYSDDCRNGYESPESRNPYLRPGDHADAFRLGQHLRLFNWQQPTGIRKSRGCFWRVAFGDRDERFRVDCGEITNPRTAPAGFQAVTDAGGWEVNHFARIDSRLGGVFIVQLRKLIVPGIWHATIDCPNTDWHGKARQLHVCQLMPLDPSRRRPAPCPKEEAAPHGCQYIVPGTEHQTTITKRQGRLF